MTRRLPPLNALRAIEIVARAGRYGPYVTEVLTEEESGRTGKAKVKPRTASLFASMDLATIDLDTALKLLSLPRVVGTVEETRTAEDGSEQIVLVEITVQNGRYGPYLKKGTDSRSIESEDQIFTITLDEAKAIYAEPKRRGRAAAKPPLKELGEDPVSKKPIVVKDGRFGPYVTDGETNATLRRGDDPETITPERGQELLAEKRGIEDRSDSAKGSMQAQGSALQDELADWLTARRFQAQRGQPPDVAREHRQHRRHDRRQPNVAGAEHRKAAAGLGPQLVEDRPRPGRDRAAPPARARRARAASGGRARGSRRSA